jgi:hypothetical protein
MVMRFVTWNVRKFHCARAINAVASNREKYRKDLVVVQEVRWEGNATLESRNILFFCGIDNINQ